MKPAHLLFLAAVLTGVGSSLRLYGHGSQIATAGGSGGPVTLTKLQQTSIGVKTVPADFRSVNAILRLNGSVTLDPDRRAHVTTRISGRVEKLFASIGSRVEKGQKLALIQSRQPGDPPPEIEVTAPVGGVVNARGISVGDAVEPNTELFDLVDLSKVIVLAQAYEEDVGKVKLGQTVRIVALSYPDLELTGTVTFLGLELDPTTRTLPVWVTVDNPEGKLRVGMFTKANLLLAENPGLLTVPTDAILEEGGEKFVFVQTGDTFKRQDVQTGVADERFIEIRDGLVPSDAVVTSGQREIFTQSLTGGAKPAADKD